MFSLKIYSEFCWVRCICLRCLEGPLSMFWRMPKLLRFSIAVNVQNAPKLILATLRVAGRAGGSSGCSCGQLILSFSKDLWRLLCSGLWKQLIHIISTHYNDFLHCSGLRKQLIRTISKDLLRFHALQRFSEKVNSHYQHGFIAISCFATVCGNS